MNTVLLSLALWGGSSVLLAVTFGIGAAVGYRRAVEELTDAAAQQLPAPVVVGFPAA